MSTTTEEIRLKKTLKYKREEIETETQTQIQTEEDKDAPVKKKAHIEVESSAERDNIVKSYDSAENIDKD